MSESDQPFSFLRTNDRGSKPRRHGITEIRGPYYTPMGKRYLEDILETMGAYVDSLKFVGGSFTLIPHERLREIIELSQQRGSPHTSVPIVCQLSQSLGGKREMLNIA